MTDLKAMLRTINYNGSESTIIMIETAPAIFTTISNLKVRSVKCKII